MNWRPIIMVAGENGPKFRLRWRWFGGIFLVSVLGLWLLLIFGAWAFVKYRRDFPGVKYTDLLWPGHWPQYRVRMGDYYIGQSDALLKQG